MISFYLIKLVVYKISCSYNELLINHTVVYKWAVNKNEVFIKFGVYKMICFIE